MMTLAEWWSKCMFRREYCKQEHDGGTETLMSWEAKREENLGHGLDTNIGMEAFWTRGQSTMTLYFLSILVLV